MTNLFHCSDIHFGAEDRAALDWFAGEVASARPDAVIITGDLTMRAKHREFAAAGEWMASLGVPVTVEVGNHDMPYYNLIERFFTPYRRYSRVADKVEKEIDLPGVSIIPLNTTARAQWRFNWSKGTVRSGALRSTLSALETAPAGSINLIAAHHPLVDADTRTSGSTRGGLEALQALQKAGAHAVLTGHVHDPFDIDRPTGDGSIRLIGAGTLSERTRENPPSYNRISVADGRISVDVQFMPS